MRADSLDDSFEPWAAKKADILGRYTTSEKLSITTSFLSASDKEQGETNTLLLGSVIEIYSNVYL